MSEPTRCPGCKTEMVVMLHQAGVELDECPACKGVWLDHGELQRAAPRPPERSNELMDELAMQSVKSGPAIRRCPRCSRRLGALQSRVAAKLRADVCDEHGLFLDAGELELVRDLAATGALPPTPAEPRSDPLFAGAGDGPVHRPEPLAGISDALGGVDLVRGGLGLIAAILRAF